MRFFVPVIALLSAAVGCAESQQRPVVVLVHGRGHLEDDTASLRRTWKADLNSALATVGMSALADADVRLAWYADVLDPSVDAGCPVTRTDSDTVTFEGFARDFFGSLASAMPGDESREARMLLGDMLYVMDGSRRCGARRRVASIIDAAAASGRPVVVIAYSLGSVVSYDVLKALRAGGNRVHLITLGSPLGNPDLRALLGVAGDSLAMPTQVQSWENIYDPDDAFAAPLSRSMQGVRDSELRGDARGDPHYVRRYLRDRATGAAVGRALCASTEDSAGITACSALRAGMPTARASS